MTILNLLVHILLYFSAFLPLVTFYKQEGSWQSTSSSLYFPAWAKIISFILFFITSNVYYKLINFTFDYRDRQKTLHFGNGAAILARLLCFALLLFVINKSNEQNIALAGEIYYSIFSQVMVIIFLAHSLCPKNDEVKLIYQHYIKQKNDKFYFFFDICTPISRNIISG